MSKKDVSIYCGSEDDVLDRYYNTARLYNAAHIVRITSDCPVIDPQVIDKVVSLYFKEKADYCSNTITETFPDGEDVEIFSFKVLKIAWERAALLSEREHVTQYIRSRKKKFNIVSLENNSDMGKKRWTLDMKKDYIFLSRLFKNLYKKNPVFGMEEILQFLNEHPEIESINSNIARNEGYAKSLKEDKRIR